MHNRRQLKLRRESRCTELEGYDQCLHLQSCPCYLGFHNQLEATKSSLMPCFRGMEGLSKLTMETETLKYPTCNNFINIQYSGSISFSETPTELIHNLCKDDVLLHLNLGVHTSALMSPLIFPTSFSLKESKLGRYKRITEAKALSLKDKELPGSPKCICIAPVLYSIFSTNRRLNVILMYIPFYTKYGLVTVAMETFTFTFTDVNSVTFADFSTM